MWWFMYWKHMDVDMWLFFHGNWLHLESVRIFFLFSIWRSEISLHAPFHSLSVHNEYGMRQDTVHICILSEKDWYLKLKSTQCHLLFTFICIYTPYTSIHTHKHTHTQVVGIWTKPFMHKNIVVCLCTLYLLTPNSKYWMVGLTKTTWSKISSYFVFIAPKWNQPFRIYSRQKSLFMRLRHPFNCF